MAFHTETKMGGKIDFYHHNLDKYNNQNKENTKMKVSNTKNITDVAENKNPSSSSYIKTTLLLGLLMVTLVERQVWYSPFAHCVND